MTPAKLRLAMAAMGNPETRIGALCKELGISSQTLYRHVAPDGQRFLVRLAPQPEGSLGLQVTLHWALGLAGSGSGGRED